MDCKHAVKHHLVNSSYHYMDPGDADIMIAGMYIEQEGDNYGSGGLEQEPPRVTTHWHRHV